MYPRSIELHSAVSYAGGWSTRPRALTLLENVNFTTYFFFRDKLPNNMKMLVFFLAKCVRTAVKTMVMDRKYQKALAVLYLTSRPLRNAANSSGLP